MSKAQQQLGLRNCNVQTLEQRMKAPMHRKAVQRLLDEELLFFPEEHSDHSSEGLPMYMSNGLMKLIEESRDPATFAPRQHGALFLLRLQVSSEPDIQYPSLAK